MKHRCTFFIAVFFLSFAPFGFAQEKPDAPEPRINIMTYNIRAGVGWDGEDSWPFRYEIVSEVLKEHPPTVVGFQEALMFQIDSIRGRVPELRFASTIGKWGYGWRYNPIMFDPEVVEETGRFGEFWLSDTPDKVGSNTWGHPFPRLVSWVDFIHKESGYQFRVANSHFSHTSNNARFKAAKVTVRRLRELRPAIPTAFLGDLNALPNSSVLKALLAPVKKKWGLLDAHKLAPDNDGPAGTYHGFRGRPIRRIDYILTTPGLRPVSSGIVRYNRDGRYPSDHFPMMTELAIRRPVKSF